MRNAFDEQVGVRDWYQLVGFAVNDKRGSFDLRDAAVGFPGENALQLAEVTLRSWIPLHADGHVFVNARARGGGVIDIRDDGFFGFFRRHALAHEKLQDFRGGAYGVGTAGVGATQD